MKNNIFLKMVGVLLMGVFVVIFLNKEGNVQYHYAANNNNDKSIENVSNGAYVNMLSLNFGSILDSLKKFFGGNSSGSSNANNGARITSNNVCAFIKTDTTGKKKLSDYCSDNNLHAEIYYANNKSSNWALLVHGNMMSGSSMAKSVGQMYLDNNINVLAIDLRGFGDSKGSVAMGFLESLDVMDWLDYLNKEQNAKKIVIHGVSLGGATTLQTLTLGGLNVDGIGTLPSISSKNVVGVVDDCGYTSMTGIITGMLSSSSSKSNSSSSSIFNSKANSLFGSKFKTGAFDSIIKSDTSQKNISLDGLIKVVLSGDLVKTGLNTNNFDRYQDSFGNGRKADSNVKVMIVHGQSDTTVSPDNAKTVEQNVGSNVIETYYPSGAPHAFIVVGLNKNDYISHINSFLGKVNMKQSSSLGNSNNSSDSSNSGSSNGILDFFKKLFSR